MWTQSLTPARRTLWLPTGRPALVSLSTARLTSGVISLGWLKCRLIQSGWYFSSIVQSSSSIRWGRKTGTRTADPDDLDVGDLAEPAEDALEELRGQRQAVAAGDEDVADLGRPAQVVELGLVLLAVEVLGRVADDPAPGAIPAVARALGRDEHEDAVRVAVDQARDRRMAVLGQRVLHHRRERLLLAAGRDDLAADRVGRVVRVDEADEVGRDVHPELVRARTGPRARPAVRLRTRSISSSVLTRLLSCQRQSFHLSSGTSRVDRGAAADGGPAVRPERPGRIARVDPRRVGGGAAAWWAAASLDLPGVHAVRSPRAAGLGGLAHKVYAVCKSGDHSARVPPGPADRDGRRRNRAVSLGDWESAFRAPRRAKSDVRGSHARFRD